MNNNKVHINCVNGLGDKLLDIIGFNVICKYMKYNERFVTPIYSKWGVYNMNLIDIKDFTFVPNKTNEHYFIDSCNSSVSLCPINTYNYLKQYFPQITFEEVSKEFITYGQYILQPSENIKSKIPSNITNCYGVHLRKSDKICDTGDYRHENTLSEFNIIQKHLLEHIQEIVKNETEPNFLVVSEDEEYKNEIKEKILSYGNVKILTLDYSNIDKDIFDLFCLSNCKEILQGVKYSSFSVTASLLGNRKIHNYYSNDMCLINLWSSVLHINNNELNYNELVHTKITDSALHINTNIQKINE